MQSSSITLESTSASQEALAPKKNLKVIQPGLYSVGNDIFKISYVQPDPLPSAIASLQTLHVQGLDFVKVPINDKDDRLYIKSVIFRLLRQPGISSDYVDMCITNYNKIQSSENRGRLLRLMRFALDYYDFNGFEFLSDPCE
jgi:hypothetical protein